MDEKKQKYICNKSNIQEISKLLPTNSEFLKLQKSKIKLATEKISQRLNLDLLLKLHFQYYKTQQVLHTCKILLIFIIGLPFYLYFRYKLQKIYEKIENFKFREGEKVCQDLNNNLLNTEGIDVRFIQGKIEIDWGQNIDGFLIEFVEIEEMKDEVMKKIAERKNKEFQDIVHMQKELQDLREDVLLEQSDSDEAALLDKNLITGANSARVINDQRHQQILINGSDKYKQMHELKKTFQVKKKLYCREFNEDELIVDHKIKLSNNKIIKGSK